MLRAVALMLLLSTISKLSIGNPPILLFPKSTVFQFSIGISVPLITNNKGTIATSFAFQFNYALPWNLTQLHEPGIIPSRENHDFNLHTAYAAIEQLLDTYGWRNGRECLLRSICELAEAPLVETDRDILQEVIHLFLTPTGDFPPRVNSSYQGVNKLYHEAELLGRSGGDCTRTYSNCLESPLKSFTKITLTPG
ncbi:uncharacterized protein LOC135170759 isoform X2 [Diachasmimorpha longicaudata]|uniref:uncharacterized protein LOC135170759 isoform X2 n=1 Tax=Diachasmimorpha longicaudata TaxID=58733 RepID=UPI0030B89953